MEINLLICTECGVEHPIEEAHIRCRACGGALELPLVRGADIGRAYTFGVPLFSWYRSFFPYFPDYSVLDMGEGFTPLLDMPELADETGADVLFVKNETVNPTWSFKDRGTAAGIRRALQLGYSAVGAVSSGNMALSVAAYGARAGMKTFLFVPENIDEEKLAPILLYGPTLIKVSGDLAALYEESLRIGRELGIYFLNADEPFRVEGYKTLAYEICEQLRFDVPDYVVIPTSAGGHIRGVLKGFLEMRESGLIGKLPRLVAVQPEGCAPIANAFTVGARRIQRVEHPSTIAHAIQNPFPPSGNATLKALYETDGLCLTVTDQEMLQSQRELARGGLFMQPESAAAHAAVKRMGQEGVFAGKERVVAVATSSGFKYTSILHGQQAAVQQATLETLQQCVADRMK